MAPPLLNDALERFAALSLRERILIGVGVAAVGFLALDRLVLTTLRERQAELETQRATLDSELTALRARRDGDATPEPSQADLAAKRQQRDALAERLQAAQRVREDLIARPLAATEMMRRALRTPSRMVVNSMKVLPVQPLKSGSTATLYRHGIELQLRGGYGDLVDHLARLEQDPRIFWSGMRLATTSYPENTLTISLYTISTSELPELR